ncbi:MAG TPA: hypothetical protein PLS05_03440 [Clostridia bacterium]|jgi:beta-fructofuranosidase|nr:hypothetical protein [Clostridia bacterium]HPO53579.1 hypothetical protein [Clostridia bacterium]
MAKTAEKNKGTAPYALACFEGGYYLFYGGGSLSGKCYIASSHNLLDWQNIKTVITEPAIIGGGAVMPRNGKYAYLYLKKGILGDTIRMATTSDFLRFKRHPLPVLTCKRLPKKCRGMGAPRVVKSGEFYYMAIPTRVGKGGGVLVYKSLNLIDWRYGGMLSGFEGKAGYPALIQLEGAHILFEQRGKYPLAVFGYRLGSAKLDDGAFLPFTEFKPIGDIVSPRITTLPDGRVILIGALRGEGGKAGRLALPKEITLEDGKIKLRPVRELYAKRKNERAFAFTAKKPMVSLEGLSGRVIELNVFADLKAAEAFRIGAFMSGCRGLFITLRKGKGIVELEISNFFEKVRKFGSVPLPQSDIIDMQLILLGESFECFINGGEICVSGEIDKSLCGCSIGFDAGGEAPCEIVAYDLQ